jgi:hypothetical protein
MVLLPPSGPLPANATSYLDSFPPSGLSCYFGAALGSGGNVLGITDMLCTVPNTRSLFGAPQNVRMQLNQSNTASMSWSAPIGVIYDGFAVLPLGGTPQLLPASTTTYTLPLSGPTCVLVIATRMGSPVGNGDAICGVTGVSTLGV